MLPGITDAFLLAQRGFLDVGFIGGAQIDRYGNLNTSAIGGSYERPKVRLPGSGGANDIISLCREVIILTVHEKRRFSETVDFITSPGWLDGGESRRKSGLLFGGVSRVVTTLGVFGFEPESRRMRLEALHPGVSVDDIQANTGFELGRAPTIETTTTILTAVTGELIINGVAMGTVTGLKIQVDELVTADGPVVGSNLSPDMSRGRIKVVGSFTAYFQDQTLTSLFQVETRIALIAVMLADATAASDFIAITIGALKLNADAPDDAEKGIVRSFTFTAEINQAGGAALAWDQTIMTIQDSAA